MKSNWIYVNLVEPAVFNLNRRTREVAQQSLRNSTSFLRFLLRIIKIETFWFILFSFIKSKVNISIILFFLIISMKRKNRLLMKMLYVWNLIFFYIQKMINSFPKLMCSIPVIFTTHTYHPPPVSMTFVLQNF